MAEAPEIMTVPDDDDDIHWPGPCNQISADEYVESLDNIVLQFKESVLEDQKDALLSAVNSLKCKMMAQFEQMCPVYVEIVMQMIKDTRCLTLRQSMESVQVAETNPDEEIPTGHEMVSKLTQEKKLSQAAISNIISLFGHLSEAHAHMSTAAANLSALRKITDPVTFKTILQVSVCPIVQLLIPKRF